MADEDRLRDRIHHQSEDALARLAQELIDSQLLQNAASRMLEAREKAAAAQEAAMSALNIPSAADIERLTRRLRSVSQRLEGIEDAVDRLEERLAAGLAGAGSGALEARLERIEAQLAQLVRLAERRPPARKPPARSKPKPKQ